MAVGDKIFDAVAGLNADPTGKNDFGGGFSDRAEGSGGIGGYRDFFSNRGSPGALFVCGEAAAIQGPKTRVTP